MNKENVKGKIKTMEVHLTGPISRSGVVRAHTRLNHRRGCANSRFLKKGIMTMPRLEIGAACQPHHTAPLRHRTITLRTSLMPAVDPCLYEWISRLEFCKEVERANASNISLVILGNEMLTQNIQKWCPSFMSCTSSGCLQ